MNGINRILNIFIYKFDIISASLLIVFILFLAYMNGIHTNNGCMQKTMFDGRIINKYLIRKIYKIVNSAWLHLPKLD